MNNHIIDISYELTDESPKYKEKIDTNINLKPHQLTLLQKCIDIENNNVILSNYPNILDRFCDISEEDYLSTDIGVLGDCVGSGKSYVILALIKTNKQIKKQGKQLITYYGSNKVLISKSPRPVNFIDVNILVIPHLLTKQWCEYIEKFDINTKYILINKKKSIEGIKDNQIDITEYEIIVVTNTKYNDFVKILKTKEYKVKRLIFDEIDNLNIPSTEELDSCFYWFITATYENLFTPNGTHYFDIELRRYITYLQGIRNNGFVKNIFNSLAYFLNREYLNLLVVKNNNEYIKQSFCLPDIIYNIIKCREPISVNVLNGVIDTNIIHSLNAGDVERAISLINSNNKGTEENIIKIMIDKYEKELENLDIHINAAERLNYDTETIRQNNINKFIDNKKEIEEKINCIKDRISNSDMCTICYCELQNKTITKCCSNSFCLKCISTWLNIKNTCPMCKKRINQKDLYTKVTSIQNIKEIIEEYNEENDKLMNLQIFLKKREKGSKILIFSEFENTFKNIETILKNTNIKYSLLKGNSFVIQNIIKNYKESDLDILLINTKNYGSGLNLENTTDIVMMYKFDNEIEKQVIGRAHRPGRTSSLKVHYFLYNNEMLD